jgi:zeaxanthin epoxidase
MEDGYVLTNLLKDVTKRSQIPKVLKKYYSSRIVRTAAVQGLSRIASDLIITQVSISTTSKYSLSC